MIFDADTHISPFSISPYDIRYEELLRRLDRAGVDRALVWLRPPYLRDIQTANRYVYEATRAHPDRLVGFGWADPHLGIEPMRDEIRRCVDEYGFYGVKLNGAQNEFYIDDERLSLPLVEAVAATGKVLAFHIGTDAYEATHPYRLRKIAQHWPDLRILMVHLGGVAFHDLSDAAIEVLRDCSNVTAIGSAVRPVNVLKAIRAVGTHRICFGSDAPFNLIHVEVAAYQALLDGELSKSDIAAVMNDNICRVLGC